MSQCLGLVGSSRAIAIWSWVLGLSCMIFGRGLILVLQVHSIFRSRQYDSAPAKTSPVSATHQPSRAEVSVWSSREPLEHWWLGEKLYAHKDRGARRCSLAHRGSHATEFRSRRYCDAQRGENRLYSTNGRGTTLARRGNDCGLGLKPRMTKIHVRSDRGRRGNFKDSRCSSRHATRRSSLLFPGCFRESGDAPSSRNFLGQDPVLHRF